MIVVHIVLSSSMKTKYFHESIFDFPQSTVVCVCLYLSYMFTWLMYLCIINDVNFLVGSCCTTSTISMILCLGVFKCIFFLSQCYVIDEFDYHQYDQFIPIESYDVFVKKASGDTFSQSLGPSKVSYAVTIDVRMTVRLSVNRWHYSHKL